MTDKIGCEYSEAIWTDSEKYFGKRHLCLGLHVLSFENHWILGFLRTCRVLIIDPFGRLNNFTIKCLK